MKTASDFYIKSEDEDCRWLRNYVPNEVQTMKIIGAMDGYAQHATEEQQKEIEGLEGSLKSEKIESSRHYRNWKALLGIDKKLESQSQLLKEAQENISLINESLEDLLCELQQKCPVFFDSKEGKKIEVKAWHNWTKSKQFLSKLSKHEQE